jgi:raffinose/stachyose/melibiose transport system permease protein
MRAATGKYLSIVAFVGPALALFLFFVVGPLVSALGFSLFEWSGTSRGMFSGVENFVALFTELPFREELPRALSHNLLIFVGIFIVQNTVGLALAMNIQRRRRSRRALQTIVAIPYLVSALVVGYLWSLLLSPAFGPVNAFLKSVGLDWLALPWLGDPNLAMITLTAVAAWAWLGFPVLLYSAALAGLPQDVEQAAMVDGASAWQRFWFVTLPLLTPAIGTVTILSFIHSMEIFGLAYALGGSTGSPAGGTDVVGLLFYRTSFRSGSPNAIGMSSALATVMFVLILVTSLVATRLLRQYEKRLA